MLRWIGYRVLLMKKEVDWGQVPSDIKEKWEKLRIHGRWKEEDSKEGKEKCVIS